MKLRYIIFLLGMISISACNNSSIQEENSTFSKAMSEGKIAIASKEYEKAEGLFELAKTENTEDIEAKNLYNQTHIILEIQDLLEKGMIEEANIKFEELNNIDSDIDIIKKNAKELIENFDYNDINTQNTDNHNENIDVVNNTVEEPKGNLVLDYVVNQSEEELNNITYRDGDGKIVLQESDYSMSQPVMEGHRLVSSYTPETYVNFSLNNIGDETITNPIINFKFNNMSIEFTQNEVWEGIEYERGIGTWYEIRWTPEPGTTIQPNIPINFILNFQNAIIYNDNTSVDVTLSGDNFRAKTFNIPIELISY